MPRTIPAYGTLAAALTAAAGWSLAGVFIRLAPSLSLEAITLGRFAVGLVAISGAIVLTKKSRPRPRLVDDLLQPATWSLGGLMVTYYLLTTAAFRLAPVAEVAVLVGTAPILSLSFERLRGIAIGNTLVVGTGLAVLGVILIFVPVLEVGQYIERGFGNGLALGAAACRAFFAYVSQCCKNRGTKTDPLSVSIVTFGAGTIALVVWLAVQEGTPESASIITCVPVLLLGLLSTVVPTLSYAIASSRLSPVLTTNLTLLSPLLATTWGVTILREWPSMWFLGGAGLVLSGLVIVLRSELGSGSQRARKNQDNRRETQSD